MTLEELAARGSGDNPHVIVTNFTCGSDYAFQIQTPTGGSPTPHQTGYGRAWIPLFPKAVGDNLDAGSPPTRFVVLLETSPTTASGSGFHLLSRRPSVEGLAIPLLSRSMEPEVRRYLAKGYPDTDFSQCLVVVEYEPYEKKDAALFASVFAVCTWTGLAIGLPVLALGIIFQRIQKKSPARRDQPAETGSPRRVSNGVAMGPLAKVRSLYQGGLLIVVCSVGVLGVFMHAEQGKTLLAVTQAVACVGGFGLAVWLIRRALLSKRSTKRENDSIFIE
jgi:hypothetical protein